MASAAAAVDLLTVGEFRDLHEPLSVLLVAAGASLGFAHPLTHEAAAAFWSGVADDAARGGVVALAATVDGELAGCVLLNRARYPNGRHRAEVSELIVKPSQRRRGIGSALLRHAEAAARDMGLTLLFLDTQADSAAEHLYAKAGWTRAGVIPGFAYRPDGGGPDPTAIWYRLLD